MDSKPNRTEKGPKINQFMEPQRKPFVIHACALPIVRTAHIFAHQQTTHPESERRMKTKALTRTHTHKISKNEFKPLHAQNVLTVAPIRPAIRGKQMISTKQSSSVNGPESDRDGTAANERKEAEKGWQRFTSKIQMPKQFGDEMLKQTEFGAKYTRERHWEWLSDKIRRKGSFVSSCPKEIKTI